MSNIHLPSSWMVYGWYKRFAQGATTVARASELGRRVSIGSKTDIRLKKRDVRFTPESGHQLRARGCPLSANSRHAPLHPIISSRAKSARRCGKLNHADGPAMP